MTQTQLAGLVNMSQESVTLWENNHREVNAVTLIQLADIFGVTVDYLLGLSDESSRRRSE